MENASEIIRTRSDLSKENEILSYESTKLMEMEEKKQ